MEAPSCARDCCYWSRPTLDFQRMTKEEQLDVLKYSQVGFISVNIIHIAIYFLWSAAVYVPGFVHYDGSSSVNANTHAVWWQIIDLAVLLWGVCAAYFTLHYTREGRIEKGVARTHQWLLGYMVVAGIGTLVNAVHTGLTIGELVPNCDSTLCAQYKWCFVALLICLILHNGILLFSILRALAYYHNLKSALEAGLELDIGGGGGGGGVVDDESPTNDPPVKGTASNLNDMNRQITTPLLQARFNGKIQHVAPRHQSMRK